MSALESLKALLSAPSAPGARDVEALLALDDPRTVGPLHRTLLDDSAVAAVRVACGEVLRQMENAPDVGEAELRSWWSSGDEVLRGAALSRATRREWDLVEPVLDDPAHPLHLTAIEALKFDFATPASAKRLASALSHRDPVIRATAAEALAWDEPLSALPALLRAARDDEPRVAAEALHTLHHYPTLATLEVARSHAVHACEGIRNAARGCIDAVTGEIGHAPELARLDHWLGPVGGSSGFEPEPDADEPAWWPSVDLVPYEWLASADGLRKRSLSPTRPESPCARRSSTRTGVHLPSRSAGRWSTI